MNLNDKLKIALLEALVIRLLRREATAEDADGRDGVAWLAAEINEAARVAALRLIEAGELKPQESKLADQQAELLAGDVRLLLGNRDADATGHDSASIESITSHPDWKGPQMPE